MGRATSRARRVEVAFFVAGISADEVPRRARRSGDHAFNGRAVSFSSNACVVSCSSANASARRLRRSLRSADRVLTSPSGCSIAAAERPVGDAMVRNKQRALAHSLIQSFCYSPFAVPHSTIVPVSACPSTSISTAHRPSFRPSVHASRMLRVNHESIMQHTVRPSVRPSVHALRKLRGEA